MPSMWTNCAPWCPAMLTCWCDQKNKRNKISNQTFLFRKKWEMILNKRAVPLSLCLSEAKRSCSDKTRAACSEIASVVCGWTYLPATTAPTKPKVSVINTTQLNGSQQTMMPPVKQKPSTATQWESELPKDAGKGNHWMKQLFRLCDVDANEQLSFLFHALLHVDALVPVLKQRCPEFFFSGFSLPCANVYMRLKTDNKNMLIDVFIV